MLPSGGTPTLILIQAPMSSMESLRVEYPPGVKPGVIIGQSGANLRHLENKSKAGFYARENHVIITGSGSAVRVGRAILQQQFDAFLITGKQQDGFTVCQYVWFQIQIAVKTS